MAQTSWLMRAFQGAVSVVRAVGGNRQQQVWKLWERAGHGTLDSHIVNGIRVLQALLA
jgi:hypothetical protein